MTFKIELFSEYTYIIGCSSNEYIANVLNDRARPVSITHNHAHIQIPDLYKYIPINPPIYTHTLTASPRLVTKQLGNTILLNEDRYNTKPQQSSRQCSATNTKLLAKSIVCTTVVRLSSPALPDEIKNVKKGGKKREIQKGLFCRRLKII